MQSFKQIPAAVRTTSFLFGEASARRRGAHQRYLCFRHQKPAGSTLSITTIYGRCPFHFPDRNFACLRSTFRPAECAGLQKRQLAASGFSCRLIAQYTMPVVLGYCCDRFEQQRKTCCQSSTSRPREVRRDPCYSTSPEGFEPNQTGRSKACQKGKDRLERQLHFGKTQASAAADAERSSPVSPVSAWNC